jgi:hypothetical protein
MVDRQADKIECRQGSRMVGIASDLHVVGGKRASRIRHDNTTNYALDEVSREGECQDSVVMWLPAAGKSGYGWNKQIQLEAWWL